MFNAEHDRAIIQEIAEALCPELPDKPTLVDLSKFVELAANWDRVHDLTAAKSPEALAEILCADAFVLARHPSLSQGFSVLDVGSGGGAPAIPLALLREDLKFTLYESRQKRVAFMRLAIGSLQIHERVKVIQGHLDPDAPQVSGMPFDLAMSRATFSLEQWMRTGLLMAPRVALFAVNDHDFAPVPEGYQASDLPYTLPISKAPRLIRVQYESGKQGLKSSIDD
ncbi:MAG: class I SAM-dependent methyltransferase [Myxococcales bacterium]|nr:MAG: class I SAM-dependent methyltransferase [Myxococcales bacterium]